MPTPAYIPVANVTISVAVASVTFASLPAAGTYRDLILVSMVGQTLNTGHNMRVNSDSGSNYPFIQMFGDGSSPVANTGVLTYFTPFINSNPSTNLATPTLGMTEFLDYAQTDKQKNILCSSAAVTTGASPMVARSHFRWGNSSAITSILIYPVSGTIGAGSTFNLYGIKA
jgi:hypothetical protein